MRVLLVYFVGSLVFINFCFGQSDSSGGSSIYLIRPPLYFAYAVKMKIRSNNQSVIKLQNGSYYKHDVLPGKYVISCKMVNADSIDLIVEKDKNYYVICYLTQGFFGASPVIEMLDSLVGKSIIKSQKLESLAYQPISDKKPKSRLGFSLGGGAGFEKIIMGYTETDEKVTLSTGGGLTMGLEYGYELFKYFDLALNSFFQISLLSPKVENAKANFKRFGIILTPSLLMPVKGGEYLRFRLGAGAGVYLMNKMTISTLPVEGTENILKYKPSLGFHGSFVFESNFSDHSSSFIGIKYYKIRYNYTAKGSNSISADPLLNEPNGSGFDFYLGMNYRF